MPIFLSRSFFLAFLLVVVVTLIPSVSWADPAPRQPAKASSRPVRHATSKRRARKRRKRRRSASYKRAAKQLALWLRQIRLTKKDHVTLHVAIPKGLLAFLMRRLNLLAVQAAIVPTFSKGKTVGFRIFRIRKGGFYDRIGLHNNDVLVSINGYRFTSPQKALEAYASLSKARILRVLLLRQGKPHMLVLRLVTNAPTSRPGASSRPSHRP